MRQLSNVETMMNRCDLGQATCLRTWLRAHGVAAEAAALLERRQPAMPFVCNRSPVHADDASLNRPCTRADQVQRQLAHLCSKVVCIVS